MLPLCCPVVSAHATRMLSLCVPSLCGHHCCIRCVAMHGVSSHCSSLPPCSEMMIQQVTFDILRDDHTSHAVCASISTCMRDAIQFCNLLPAGRALPAMADAALSLLLESEPPQRKSAVRRRQELLRPGLRQKLHRKLPCPPTH